MIFDAEGSVGNGNATAAMACYLHVTFNACKAYLGKYTQITYLYLVLLNIVALAAATLRFGGV